MKEAQHKPRKLMHVWMVEDAPGGTDGTTKSFWTKIGIAVVNDDGSLSLTLAAVPVTGKMILRDATPTGLTTIARGAA